MGEIGGYAASWFVVTKTRRFPLLLFLFKMAPTHKPLVQSTYGMPHILLRDGLVGVWEATFPCGHIPDPGHRLRFEQSLSNRLLHSNGIPHRTNTHEVPILFFTTLCRVPSRRREKMCESKSR